MRKPKKEFIRTSISVTGKLWKWAMDRMDQEGFATFSEYISDLIRKDTKPEEPSKKVPAAL